MHPTALVRTSRVSPGSCPYLHEHLHGATSDSFTIDLGSTYVGKTLYVQLHVTTSGGGTAFAGWTPDGSGSFYGNVVVDAIEGTPVPMGTVGALGFAAIAGVGLVVAQRRRRRPVASSA